MLNAHDPTEVRPAFITHTGETEQTIFGAKRAPHALQKLMPTSGPASLDTATNRSEVNLHWLQSDHRAVDASIDLLAFAGFLASVEGGQDARHQCECARMVSN